MRARTLGVAGGVAVALSLALAGLGCTPAGCPDGYVESMGRCLDPDAGVDSGIEVDGGPDSGTSADDGGVDASTTLMDGGACVPGTETCNGADDDCDGWADEGETSWTLAGRIPAARGGTVQITAAADGFLIAYTNATGLYASQLDASGGAVGGASLISSAVTNAAGTFAVSGNGAVMAVAYLDGASLRGAVVSASTSGAWIGSNLAVATTAGAPFGLDVALDAYNVVFMYQSGTDVVAVSRALPALAGITEPAVVISGVRAFDAASPGGLTGAFVAYTTSDGGRAVRLQRVSGVGAHVGEPFDVTPDDGLVHSRPQLAAQLDGSRVALAITYSADASAEYCTGAACQGRLAIARMDDMGVFTTVADAELRRGGGIYLSPSPAGRDHWLVHERGLCPRMFDVHVTGRALGFEVATPEDTVCTSTYGSVAWGSAATLLVLGETDSVLTGPAAEPRVYALGCGT